MKKVLPLVSVLVPAYNVEQYLTRCLNSIFNQTYKNLEVIVVNDASTDKVFSILNSCNDQRLKTINHQTNKGLFLTRLSGIENATGDYITFIDSDDFVSLDYIEQLVERAMSTKADIILAESVLCNPKTGEKDIKMDPKNVSFSQVIIGENEPLSLLLSNDTYFWEIWGKLYSKDVINKAYQELKKIDQHIISSEDFLCSIYFFYYCSSFARSEFSFYYYIRNKDSHTQKIMTYDEKLKALNDTVYVKENVELFLSDKKVLNKFIPKLQYLLNLMVDYHQMGIDEMDISVIQRETLFSLSKSLGHINTKDAEKEN